MKICITSLGPDLDSPIDPRFGRAQYLLLLDQEGNLEEALPNSGIEAMRGAGIAAAQQIVNKGIKILITGNIGPNAFGVLAQSGVKVALVPPGVSVKEAFKMWEQDKLSLVRQPTVPGHFGMGPPPGRRGPRGGGFGRGRGGGPIGPPR